MWLYGGIQILVPRRARPSEATAGRSSPLSSSVTHIGISSSLRPNNGKLSVHAAEWIDDPSPQNTWLAAFAKYTVS
jgi:hypothetical protein